MPIFYGEFDFLTKDTHVDAHDGKIDVAQDLVMKLDRQAGAEEDHDLFLLVLVEKCE